MVTTPRDALERLRRDARAGTLAERCARWGVELLVAFGSAVNADWPAEPHDLDLAVIARKGTILDVLDALVAELGLEDIDVMDLERADEVARLQALGRGELLHEATPGMFAERQIVAVVQYADTQWLRDLELAVLAR